MPDATATPEAPEAPAVAQQLAQIVAALPDDAAREVLHFAEYMALRTKAADERWDALFAATTPEQWAKMAEDVRAQIRAGKTRPLFDAAGEVALP